MSLRLFIGVPIKIDSSLENAIKRVRISADKKRMEVNWVPKDNLHVTLNFLGDTDEEKLPELESLLSDTAETMAPVTTSLRGLGAFPDERHARVLWVGVRKSRELSALQRTLESNLVSAGFLEPEERTYAPHLTIGRLRKSRSATDLLSPWVRSSFSDVDIREIVLFQSVLHGANPVYKALHRFELSTVRLEKSDEVDDSQTSF